MCFCFFIDIFSKCPWIVHLKNRNNVTIANALPNILNSSKRKLSKIWVDRGSRFYNKSMKSWLGKNNIEMYSTHNEVSKSVVAERFIRNLTNKIYKDLTSVSENVYIDT